MHTCLYVTEVRAALWAVGKVDPVPSYVPAGLVLAMGLLTITVCVRQQDPPVPFIAILALIVFVLVAAFGIFVGFAPRR